MDGAVGGVQVDHHVRVVTVEQPHQGPGFRRVQLHVVTVEVVALGIGAPSHAAQGAVLARAVVEANPFVAVGVVNGRHQEHQGVQPRGVFALGQFAQQHQRGFLAAHFAGVNVGLHQHARLAGAPHGLGGGVGHVPGRHQRQRPSLDAVAEVGQVDFLGSLAHGFQERDHVLVARRLLVPGGLGAGLQLIQGFALRPRSGRKQNHRGKQATLNGAAHSVLLPPSPTASGQEPFLG